MNTSQTQSFTQTIEKNKEKIYRICKVYAESPIEPQDLFQEVVYEVWKSYASFKSKSSIDTWIYRIALNVSYRSKTKLSKKNGRMVKLDAIRIEPTINSKDDDQEEKYYALRQCINSLNKGDQSIMVLYLENLPYKEIAAITGLTENHIAVKMKRIRKLLFECITPKIN